MKLLYFLDKYIAEHTKRQESEGEPEIKYFLGGGLAALHALRDMINLCFDQTELEWNGNDTNGNKVDKSPFSE